MSIKKVHLRKILQIMDSPENKVVSLLRSDIRQEIAKEKGAEGGGDFHCPFWADVKHHLFYNSDLAYSVEDRIQRDPKRRRLYDMLHKQFVNWWSHQLRWRNETITPHETETKGNYIEPESGGIIKVQNILALKIGDDEKSFVYPYFSEKPLLTEQSARLGLWIISQSIPKVDINDFRILDVLRSRDFSVRDNPFTGNERADFAFRYHQILNKWEELKKEY